MIGGSVPQVRLHDRIWMPRVGLGTWPMDDSAAERVVSAAAELGYRHFDTATKYGNESGAGIRASGLPRGEVFVTTKLNGDYQGEGRAVAGVEAALGRLGMEYVDLLLIHWPLPDRDEYISTWRTFETLRDSGLTRAIGVSNFKTAHLRRLIADTEVLPAVNQIQVNPQIPRAEQRQFHAAEGIVTESWSPLGSGKGLLDDDALATIARVHERSPAQVVLRWHLQHGLVPIPRSTSIDRLRSNLEVFDFELTEPQMRAIDALAVPGAGVESDVDGH